MTEDAQPTLLRRLSELRPRLAILRAGGCPVVLVPTMGDLHAGHLELVKVAAQVGHPLVSIFVNPTQFGPGEDLAAYPRDLKADMAKLASLGVACDVFAPEPDEMYAPGDATRVEVSGISEPLCGSHRPGHFRGVTTIVARLLVSVGPEFAVFGQKDAQQCLVLERMVRDLGFPTRLIICSTIREADGLALSSRNRYLSADDRKQALALSAALRAGRAALAAGERDVTSVEATMKASSGEIDLDYAQLLSLPDLSEKMRAEGHMLLAIAGRIGRARLIDNLCVRIEADSVLDAPLLPAATLQSILKAQEE